MAALTGILITPGFIANTATAGLRCLEGTIADVCADRKAPWSNIVGFSVDFALPIHWMADFTVIRNVPMAWLFGSFLPVSRKIPISWSAGISMERTLPIEWQIPFIDVDRKLSIQFSRQEFVDRIMAVAWEFNAQWIDQIPGEADAWVDQVDGEVDAWTDQVAGESDLWSKI